MSLSPNNSTATCAAAMVAQSCAIAVQDAVDGLRNLEAISTTAIGVALAQYLATKDDSYLKAISTVQSVMSSAVNDFRTVGTAAAQVMDSFVPPTPAPANGNNPAQAPNGGTQPKA